MAFYIFFVGLFFGLLQSAQYFLVQAYVSASFLGYFCVLFAWFGGIIVALVSKKTLSVRVSFILSAVLYGLLWFLLSSDQLHEQHLGLILGLIAGQTYGLGVFLKRTVFQVQAHRLLFHENNGFIAGLILGLSAFLFLGHGFLLTLPLLGILIAFAPVEKQEEPSLKEGIKSIFTKNSFLLFLCGMNSVLLQYLVTRQFALILSANEISILMVGAAYLSGYSIGYWLAPHVSPAHCRVLVILFFISHLFLILFTPVIAGMLVLHQLGWAALAGLMISLAALTSLVYSIFLPVLIQKNGPQSLASHYAADLAGAMTAGLILFFGYRHIEHTLLVLYLGLFLILIGLVWESSRGQILVLSSCVAVFVLAVLWHQELIVASRSDYYQLQRYTYPELLYSKNSFYHAVDVLDTYAEPEKIHPKKRVSFINGVRYFEAAYHSNGYLIPDSSGLGEFTYFLAELPAKYLSQKLGRPLRVLIMGGGSLSTMGRVSPYASKVTLVEIDPAVIESSKLYWKTLNRWDEINNAEIILGDAKHYLKRSSEQFDLIINDVSAPYYLGSMLMHSRELYELVLLRLSPEGVFSESTQTKLEHEDPNSMSMRILKGVADVFPHYAVVSGAKKPRGRHGYVYARLHNPMDVENLKAVIGQDGKDNGAEFFVKNSRELNSIAGARPYQIGDMASLITNNVRRISSRLKLEGRGPGSGREKSRKAYQAMKFILPEVLLRVLLSRWTWLLAGFLIAAGTLSVSRKRDQQNG